MNLDQITANIRLRTPWEAIDLGFAMVASWWQSIYFPLATVTIGIAATLYFVLPQQQLWLAGLIFWWLKPLYDRLVLYIISRRLFNEQLSAWNVLKSLPSQLRHSGFIQSLTWRRFSLSRGFNLPLWQLEQLRGSERAKRQQVLHLASHSQAMALTLCMFLFEWILFGSLFVLILLFMPTTMASDFLDSLLGNSIKFESLVASLNFGIYVLVVTALHPFYIAGNFALYINRRTQLEAWDIELDFRKLAQRLETQNRGISLRSVALLIIGTLLLSDLSNDKAAFAEPTPSTPKSLQQNNQSLELDVLNTSPQLPEQSTKIIKEVMQHPDLIQERKIKRWVQKNKPAAKDDNRFNFRTLDTLLQPFVKGLAWLLESILWIALGVVILLLYYYRKNWLPLFRGTPDSTTTYQAPDVLFGMDVRPESLPDDVSGAARQLWLSNQPREALSLLYRGALTHLITSDRLKITHSATEGDILALTRDKLSSSRFTYFSTLTRQWQTVAYAHRKAEPECVEMLLNQWPVFYADKTNNFAGSSIDQESGAQHDAGIEPKQTAQNTGDFRS